MNHASQWIGVALAATLLGSIAPAQTTVRVSVGIGGAQGNADSVIPSISADGRFVAFMSAASNLVLGDTNGFGDVFVYDRQSGSIDRVSVSTGGTQGNSQSDFPSISADGRFVAFHSFASTLVPGSNWVQHIYVRDRQNGTTERVSVATNGTQGSSDSVLQPSISADGRFVSFSSDAANLVAGDTNGVRDVFVRDRQGGTTERVSVASGGAQGDSRSGEYGVSISASGRFVAFSSSASNLVVNDTNAVDDIFVRDRDSGTTTRVSVATGGGEGNSDSFDPSISADGRFVAFWSPAWNLVPGDTNAVDDIFMRDRQDGTTERVSVATGGTQGNSFSRYASTSADGRFVAFWGDASNLVSGDTTLDWDIFVRDRQTGTTERVSVDTGGTPGNWSTWYPFSISADGRFVAFWSDAWNLVAGDTNGWGDVFVRDRGEPPIVASCFGDATGAACPCGNNGLAGHGCENSSSTGGALLTASGSPSLSADTLVLTASGERPTALSIFLQGGDLIAPVVFGDGLRCAGGALERLFSVQIASGGVAVAPGGSDPPLSVRSAALGDPIPMGATRHYQTYYRDSDPAFCPSLPGNSWNVSNALSAIWSP
jgi:hypothetical protein